MRARIRRILRPLVARQVDAHLDVFLRAYIKFRDRGTPEPRAYRRAVAVAQFLTPLPPVPALPPARRDLALAVEDQRMTIRARRALEDPR